MNKRQQAMELLEVIPEGKLDYIIAFLQGAAIPDRPVSNEAMEESEFSGMEDLYSALEDMARAEINLYQNKDKK